METDIAKMSNQERLLALGYEEASKYHGPYERREEGFPYAPALIPGAPSRLLLWKTGEKMPKECIIPTVSFKENKPEKAEKPVVFKKKDIKCSKRNRSRANGL